MKIDCEGEELNFMQFANLKDVLNISMEVHFVYSKRDNHKKYFELLRNMEFFYKKEEIKYPKVQDKFSKILTTKRKR